MDGINTSMDSLEISLKRLASAVEALEWATDLRMRHDASRATTQEQFALMQDDRSRLAVELDAAVDRSRALESANAVAHAMKLAPTLSGDKVLLVNLSGRGDKDMNTVAEQSGLKL